MVSVPARPLKKHSTKFFSIFYFHSFSFKCVISILRLQTWYKYELVVRKLTKSAFQFDVYVRHGMPEHLDAITTVKGICFSVF